MALNISGNVTTHRVAFGAAEEGDPALLVTGNRNVVVTGPSGTLRATGTGPAVVLTGVDTRLQMQTTTVTVTGAVALQGSAGRDTIFNVQGAIGGEVRLGDGVGDYTSSYHATHGAVYGGDGNDSVRGFEANLDATDRLDGGAGADVFFLAEGRFAAADRFAGDGGAETFRYQGAAESTGTTRYTILDFASGDRIDLSRIDAIAGTAANDAFAWIGASAFGNVAGHLRASVANGVPTIEADVNGDGVADLSVLLTVAPPLTASDFVL